ncbi:ABC transporter permease subunit [[Clostridium] fimetarium]|uniref:Autoinducer 2 import system permease protein LsrD n=1 Tax=[Clostridium] fimetarium TaxID=99656 RepID=A0A1I0NDN5_9FIRM|nr:hypothetical protein [[Clostridium] fimetarium]SEV99282.1 Ribose/xylose/arabinose/galactoside ABC-type transport system, permease component [[Clostridium] fimetarium]
MKKKLIIILKNIVCSLILPVVAFIIFYYIARSKGNSSYGDFYTWRAILTNAAMPICIGSVIGLNLKNGRMDLSSGANLALTAIIACTLTQAVHGNGFVLLGLCIIFGVLFSILTATIYISLKIPMVITAIGMVLFYESLTKVVNGGNGSNIVSTSNLNYWGAVPYSYVLAIIALLIYYIITKYSIFGYESDAITNNQNVAVNVGIKEKRTVLAIFIFSGIILGLGATIYASNNIIDQQSNLASVGIVYSNFIPIIVGLYLARYSNDAVGIFIGSITIAIIRYSLNLVGFSSLENIVIGVFIIIFSIFTNNQDAIIKKFKNRKLNLQRNEINISN